MAASASIDPARFLHEHLAQASPDLLRSLLTTMIDTLMAAEADAVCGAAHGERSEHRVNHRNGYRHRDFTISDPEGNLWCFGHYRGEPRP